MAADKKSYLRNAQKQVQKGQLDRAVASYRAILKMDPRDVKIHNTLGDIYIRCSMKQEGIKEYLWVADHYEKDGFFLRSIAICQKILNLDGGLVDVRLKLAELYSQQRLGAEAKKQFLTAADFYDKKGKVAEALEIFGKIADLDPSNLGVRVKLAKMYEKQELPHKAAQEYTRAAEGHLRQKDLARAADLLRRALELHPESPTARRCLAEYHVGKEEWAEAVRYLGPLVTGESVDIEVLKMYAGACLKTGQAGEAIEALERAREREPSSMPLKTLLGRAYMEGGVFDKALDLYNPLISDYLKDNKVEAAEDLARQLSEADPSSDKAQQRLLDVLNQKGDREETPRVYRRLAAIYEAKGLPRNAVGALEKCLELIPEDQEVKAKIAALRGGAPAPPAAPPVPAPPAEEVMEVELIDLEGEELADLSLGEVLDAELPGGEIPEMAEAVTSLFDEELPGEKDLFLGPEDVEITLEEEEEEILPAREPAVAEVPDLPEETPVEEVDLEKSELFSEDEVFSLVDDEVMESPAEPTAVEGEGGPLDWQDLKAETILPVEGAIVEAVGEEVPETAAEATAESEILDVALADLHEVSERLVPPEMAAEAEPPLTEEIPAVAADGPSEEMEEFLAEADFYLQQGLFDEAGFLYRKLTKLQPDNRDLAQRIRRLEEEQARAAKSAVAAVPEGSAPRVVRDEIAALESDLDRVFVDGRTPSVPGLKVSVSGGGGTGEGEFSDFLSELRQELDTEEVSASGPPVSDEESLSEIFQEFQEGLKEQLDEEDFETHYNLGIAYKEMELLKEALGEFVLSEKSQDRKLDSISMIALCLRDMGREEEAAAKIEEGLARAEKGSDEEKGFLYDLADLYSRHGREGDATMMFDRLFAMDPSYRDVSSRAPQGRRSRREDVEGPERTSRNKKPKVSYL